MAFTITTNAREEQQEQNTFQHSVESLMSTLPKEKGWISENNFKYQGFWHHPNILSAIISLQNNFKARPTDVFLATYPKSGTTWLKALAFSILNRNCYGFDSHPLLNTNPHDCVRCLDGYARQNLTNPNPPRGEGISIFSTHIPYTSLPKSVLDAKCRIVYVFRDPKDVLVSLWYFSCNLRPKELPQFPLQEAFELFEKGASIFGPFWDHLLGYWRARLEHPETVMFIRYEDMKREPSVYLKRLAEFLGQPFTAEEEEKDGVVDEIIKLCGFENLSNLEVNKSGMLNTSRIPIFNNVFFRKAKDGDGLNHLTPEMVQRLDQITEQKLKGSGLVLA